jgi:hypothetical protein
MLTLPPWPPDDAPLSRLIEPLEPPAAAPDRTDTLPLLPDAPPAAEAIDTSPLDVMAPPPL